MQGEALDRKEPDRRVHRAMAGLVARLPLKAHTQATVHRMDRPSGPPHWLDVMKERIMNKFTQGMLTVVVAAAACMGASSVARADDQPTRAAVPMVNRAAITGIGEYVAQHASDEQYALFQKDKGLAVFAMSHVMGEEGHHVCVAQVGLTHAPADSKASPRAPATRYLGGASDPANSPGACNSTAVRRAVDAMLEDNAEALRTGLEQTLLTGGTRPSEKPVSGRIQSVYSGMSDKGNQFITDALPAWFSEAFDYRVVAVVKRFIKIDGDNGQRICFASVGLTSRAPDGRTSKEAAAERARYRLFDKDERTQADQDPECFDPMFEGLVENNIQPASDMVNSLVKDWALVAEPGLKAPTMKDVQVAVAARAARERKAAAAAQAQEAREQRVAQQNSCTVNCVNGACVRRWPNGRSERFQAPRKFNPFNSQWEWDTSGC
jgi:hypothetical protein